jgi:hypothetical protein
VDQGRRLQGVARGLPSHFVGGQSAQFLVNLRQQCLRRRRLTARQGLENDGDFVDGIEDAIFPGAKQADIWTFEICK